MTTFTSIWNALSSAGAIMFLIIGLHLFIQYFFWGGKAPFTVWKAHDVFLEFIKKRALLFSFLLALAGMLASLVYSNIIGYAPCDLCIIQRFFLYPQVLILGFGLLKNNKRVFSLCLILSILGFLVALYNTIIMYIGFSPLPCSAAVSCTVRYVYEWGFVTIPFMSLSLFFLLIALALVGKRQTGQAGQA